MFIDYLTIIMINLVAGTALLAYYIFKGMTMDDQRPFAAGFGIVGLLGIILGLVLTFTWPLPGSYNIGYGETTTLFGGVFLATAFALYNRWDLKPVTIYAFFAGIYSVIVGLRIITLGLTKEPILSGIGFVMSGLGGVLAFPIFDLLKKNKTLRLLVSIVLIVTALLWAVTFYNSLWAHMQSFGTWVPATLQAATGQ
jgi:putative membrane protein